MWRCTVMSRNWTDGSSWNGMDQLTLFAEVRPAPMSVAPTRADAGSTATKAASTSRPSDLFGKSVLAGHVLRTAIGSELAALTGCSPNWKRRDTPAGRSWWLLDMPVRRTSGDVPGLLLPTPSAQDYGTNHGGSAGRTGKVRPSLKTMLTPTATDNLDCPSMQKWAGARELMDLLNAAIEHYPTPTASLGGAEPPGVTGRNLVTVVSNAMASDLPTPRATDAERGGRGDLIQVLRGNKTNSAHGKQRGLATPTARDWRSGKASPETMARNSRPLNEQLCAHGITQERALLAIYAWLMGFPPGFPIPRSGSGVAPSAMPSSSPSCDPFSPEYLLQMPISPEI